MSYKLNKTDGELLVELADGQIDTTTTDVTLVGRNYKGFGESFNENFIKIVENFANTAAPGNPLVGQLWYDTSDQRLKLYDGNTFRTAGGPIVSNARPSMVAGDIWIDNENNKMYFFDGTDLVLVGPEYDAGQGQTGFEVASVIDISARERVILKIWMGGTLFGVISKEEFRLSGDNKIPGYPDDPDDVIFPARQLYRKGFNLVDNSFWYQGTAQNARALVDTDGNSFTSVNFLPTSGVGTTSGPIIIENSAGISVGIGDTQYGNLKIVGSTTTIETQQQDTDFQIKTRVGNTFSNPLYVRSVSSRIGIFNTDPQYTLDVSGSLHTTGSAVIDGDLTVNGDATYVNVATLQVEDNNIELGVSGGGAAGDDTVIDGAGLIIKSTDSDKTILWDNANSTINISENVNLPLGKEFTINNQLVLSRTELGPTVATANGLSSIGTLVELNVDNITLDGNTLSTITTGLIINPAGNISVSNSRITDVTDPINPQDAATKEYVDTQLSSENVALTMDATGFSLPSAGNPYDDVAGVLESIVPAATKQNGTLARIATVSYNNVDVTGLDVQGAMNKSYLSVIAEDSSAESVVQDVNFDPVTGTANFTPTRSVMTFEVQGGSWTWVSTV